MTSSHPSPQCTAIIVAAGASRRMGFDKLASPLAGAPVLRKTLDAFLAADSITEIIVVCPLQRWEQIIGGGEYTKLVRRINGGLNRQDSVAAGLRSSEPVIAGPAYLIAASGEGESSQPRQLTWAALIALGVVIAGATAFTLHRQRTVRQ